MGDPVDIRALRGCISTIVLTGTVEGAYAACHEEMRSYNEKNGLTSIEYRKAPAVLVEAGRDAEVAHMLKEKYDFIVQIDADATFPADAVARILHTAFVAVPQADVVGGYAQLKGNFAPTIDTGSGTWEIHWPGEGILPAIRTGGHFLLCKRSAFEKMGEPPYFRTRLAWRPIDAMAEVDNFARLKLHGSNPFTDSKEWQELLEEAAKGSAGGPSGVGEDSAFCDRAKACGVNIVVDTNIVTGHVYRDVIGPHKLKEVIEKRDKAFRMAVGILE